MTVLRIRDVRLIVLATGLSALGDFVLGIPLALEIRDRTGSGVALAAFFLALYGPIVLLAGVAGRLADRAENRRVLIVVSLVQAVATLALLALPWTGALLALTALIGCGVAVGAPAEFALLPAAAGEDHIAEANGLVESARFLGMTAGPLLGGVLAAGGGFHAAIVLDAASFVAVAVAAWRLHARRAPAPAASDPADRGRARDGLAALGGDRSLTIVLATAVAALTCFSISMAAELFFIVDTLGAGQAAYGVALTVWTSGMLLGALVVARRLPPSALPVAALAGVALQGAGLFGASLAGTFGVAVGGMALGGLAHGVKNVVVRTLIHRRVDDGLRGRAFAAYNAARNAAELAAIAAGGVLVGVIGARTALSLSGVVPLALGLAGLVALRTRTAGAGRPTTTPQEVL